MLVEEVPPARELQAVHLHGKTEGHLPLNEPPPQLRRRPAVMIGLGVVASPVRAGWRAHDQEGPVSGHPLTDAPVIRGLQHIVGGAMLVLAHGSLAEGGRRWETSPTAAEPLSSPES